MCSPSMAFFSPQQLLKTRVVVRNAQPVSYREHGLCCGQSQVGLRGRDDDSCPSRTVCAKQHPAHLHGLVDVAHVFRLHVGVLLPAAHQLRKGGQQALNADAAHVHILPRHQGCSGDKGLWSGHCITHNAARVHTPLHHHAAAEGTGMRCSNLLQTAAPAACVCVLLRNRAATEQVHVPGPAIRARDAAEGSPRCETRLLPGLPQTVGGRRCGIA